MSLSFECAAVLRGLVACLVLVPASSQAVNIWDGGAGDGLWTSPTNWDDDALPATSKGSEVLFPAGAPNQAVNLGGVDRNFPRYRVQGGYTLSNGRIGVEGGGANSTLYLDGDNTISANFGTYGGGNTVIFLQSAGGTLTLNGSSTGSLKGITLSGAGDYLIAGRLRPPTGRRFEKTGLGRAVVSATGAIDGASNGRAVLQGSLILDGSSNAEGPWQVEGGRLGGTGSLSSVVSVGTTAAGGIIAPGNPATANGIGTLNLSAQLNLGSRAAVYAEVGNAGSGDRLVVGGHLDIAPGAAIYVAALPGSNPAGDYTLITHAGVRSGTFAVLDLPHGYTLRYDPNAVVLTPSAVSEDNIRYPAGAGVIDVTALPPTINGGISAIPNDGLDDTLAIQAALNAFPNGNRIIYLPNGRYDISDTLSWPAGVPGATDFKRTILEGQSRSGVTLKLADGLPAFAAGADKPVVYTGPSIPAQRFRNAVRNLSIDVGQNNPGANALQFAANNQGTVRNVRLIAPAGSGNVGLDLRGDENGPLMVRGLEVEGFARGVFSNASINGIVMEDIRVEGQREFGLDVTGQVTSIRKLVSINSVPAVRFGDPNARDGDGGLGGVPRGTVLSLIEAKLVGLSGAASLSALEGQGFTFLRDVQSAGYQRIYTRTELAGAVTIEDQRIDEYTSRSAISGFSGTPLSSLRLPIAEVPEVLWDDPATWVSVDQFGAVGNGSTDDTAAFQAAIDSGATTVYVPAPKSYRVNGEVFLRGAVRRFIGTEGRFADNSTGRLVLTDTGTAPVVVVERFTAMLPVDQRSSRTLVLRNTAGGGGVHTGAGAIFLEDVTSGSWVFNNPALSVWARQFNVEGDDNPNVRNTGASLWILGLKTEKVGTKIRTENGGATELLGAHIFDNSAPDPATPVFEVVDAAASLAGVASSTFDATNYVNWVTETRGGTSVSLALTSTATRTSANGRVLVLYAAAPDVNVDFTGSDYSAGGELTLTVQPSGSPSVSLSVALAPGATASDAAAALAAAINADAGLQSAGVSASALGGVLTLTGAGLSAFDVVTAFAATPAATQVPSLPWALFLGLAMLLAYQARQGLMKQKLARNPKSHP